MGWNDRNDIYTFEEPEELSYEDKYGEYFGEFPDERKYISRRLTRWLKNQHLYIRRLDC